MPLIDHLGLATDAPYVAGREAVQAGRTQERDAQAKALLERTHDPARVLALSDGVFAVVITLLVLEIHVPELTQGHALAEALAEVRPSFNAFVVTFILTGMYWLGHRDLFGLIRRTNRGLVWLNILYLLPICLLPFGASLLGPYGREPTALHIYGLVLVAIAVMRVMIWWYATSRPYLLWQRLDDPQRRAGLALPVFPGLNYLLAILVAAAVPHRKPADLRRCPGAVLPQHHGPAQRPETGPGIRRLHLTRDRRFGTWTAEPATP